jgi:acetyl esterase/lipase
MRKITFSAESVLLPASLLAVSALMWGTGAPFLASASWLVLAGAALAMDPRGRGLFLAGIVVATLVAGLWTGAHAVATMPNQVARMLLVEFLPTAPVLVRPLVVTLGLWSLVVALVVGLARGVASARWRHCLFTAVGVVIAFVGFSYVMFVLWPDPALSHRRLAPPLGITEVFFYDDPPVDLSDVAEVPPRPPVPPFEVRKGLSYGPHGYRNTLDLYRPQGSHGPLPVVIYIHGGGTTDGGTEAGPNLGLPDVWRDALLARGLAIANINYRLIDADPNSRHDEVTGPFPAQIQDCLAVVRFLRAEAGGLGLNPEAIGVMGHSFGGCLASLVGLAWDREALLTDTRRGVSSRVQAVVNCAGLTDLRTWGTQTRYYLKLWNLPSADYVDANSFACRYCQLPTTPLTGEGFDPTNQTVADASPITHVRPDAPPFLLVYGFRDLAVQGELLHERLKSAGVSSRLVIIPGAGHGLASVTGTGDLAAEFLRGRLSK